MSESRSGRRPESLTRAEAARRLGVTRQRIHDLLKEGRIEAGPDGKVVAASLERWMQAKQDEQYLLTVDQVASAFGVHETTVRKWAARKRLPYRRGRNNSMLFRPDDVAKFVPPSRRVG